LSDRPTPQLSRKGRRRVSGFEHHDKSFIVGVPQEKRKKGKGKKKRSSSLRGGLVNRTIFSLSLSFPLGDKVDKGDRGFRAVTKLTKVTGGLGNPLSGNLFFAYRLSPLSPKGNFLFSRAPPRKRKRKPHVGFLGDICEKR